MLASGINILFEGQNMARLMSGLAVTIKIALVAVVLSLIFGVIFGIIMTSKNLIVKAVCYPHYSDSGVAVLILLRTYKGYGHPSGR